ncbi:response regulator [Thiomicrorhabdus sp. 6S2-11]|uniref:Response regulator n=1 Tax=Thiomicrorhabdus marina TaxID=2818442 RepID=A0ABS3Q779_9GAMM|nr:response regulator [Thiomicrorhabdus marina]MBO1927670.1 response regulator [Thiomicrorhabdus marina]
MKSLKLLLVEDDDILQQIQSGYFQTYGHEVTIAADGKEALAVLKRQGFDVILMDLNMPIMDGFECSREIRKKFIQTPIVALSGNDSAETKDACFDAGMNGFLKKPTDRETFEFMMQHLLG